MRDEQPLLLSTLPPSRRQKYFAFALMAILLVAYLATAPFMNVQLGTSNAFIPVVDTVLFLTDLMTAALLFAQYSVSRSRALLVLASGYLFTALVIVPHGLTFPGAFSETGLLGANLQTTVWLYIFWHLGLPPAVLGYALLKRSSPLTASGSVRRNIVGATLGIISLVCFLTWLATGGADFLPAVMVDAMHANASWHAMAPFIVMLSIAGIIALWRRRESVLDLWLLVVLWAWLIETLLLSTTAYRFSLVWYAGRIYGLLSASVVLLVLLSQTTTLYARLSAAVVAQRRAAEAEAALQRHEIAHLMRVSMLGELSGGLAHELTQPLTAILANAEAGRLLLKETNKDIDEIDNIFSDIIAEDNRAGEVIHRLRGLLKKGDIKYEIVDLNALISSTLTLLHSEFINRRVSANFKPGMDTLHARGDSVQLQQVLLNLIINAMDAMDGTSPARRSVSVIAKISPDDHVEVQVSDSGPGLSESQKRNIFQPFYTTKKQGLGLGLSICTSIIKSHGGTLSLQNNATEGATAIIRLPTQNNVSHPSTL